MDKKSEESAMRGRLAAVLALCVLLSGCAQLPCPREMGDMALLRTMGVDQRGDGLTVTGSTGARAEGLAGEEAPALVLSAGGQSLSDACLSLQGRSDSYVFFGYVDQLLLGEELTRKDVYPVLDYFSRDEELGLGARIWTVRNGDAETALRSGGEQGVESRLSTLRTDGKLGVAALSRTAGEVYTDLLEWGTAWLPALTVADEEDTSLQEEGYAVLREGTLVGYLEGESARGLELLVGRPEQDILMFDLEGNRAAVRVIGANTRFQSTGNGSAVTCHVTAQLAEEDAPLTQAQRKTLCSLLEQREQMRMEKTLTQLQNWNCDCIGLTGGQAGAFDTMEISIKVQGEVR